MEGSKVGEVRDFIPALMYDSPDMKLDGNDGDDIQVGEDVLKG